MSLIFARNTGLYIVLQLLLRSIVEFAEQFLPADEESVIFRSRGIEQQKYIQSSKLRF